MEFELELERKTAAVNAVIERYLPEQDGFQERVAEAAAYSVKAGGKRLRPLLMQEAYSLCGGTDPDCVEPFMAAIEYIHTYSLVHDDLPAMDNDDYRRGRLTTHKKYGEDFGILAGDALLNYAYEIMLSAVLKAGDPAIMQRMAKAASVIAGKAGIYGMVGGQSLDVWLTGKPMDPKQLDFIFKLKTGALIEAALVAGAALAGADEAAAARLERAGRCIGYAFQIQDDVLDVTGTQEVLGKPVLSDEKNNKTTYVTLYGMERAKADIAAMSGEAAGIIRDFRENTFLEALVYKLASREK